jgi:hypothetical protein
MGLYWGSKEAMKLVHLTQSFVLEKFFPIIFAWPGFSAEEHHMCSVEGGPSMGLHLIIACPSNLNCCVILEQQQQ